MQDQESGLGLLMKLYTSIQSFPRDYFLYLQKMSLWISSLFNFLKRKIKLAAYKKPLNSNSEAFLKYI